MSVFLPNKTASRRRRLATWVRLPLPAGPALGEGGTQRSAPSSLSGGVLPPSCPLPGCPSGTVKPLKGVERLRHRAPLHVHGHGAQWLRGLHFTDREGASGAS